MVSIGRNVQNGISQAQGNNQASTIPSTRAIATPSADPTSVMAAANQDNIGQATIKLPSDLPPYYFRITISNYTRASWLQVGDLHPSSWVLLPMPANIVDTQSVEWEGNEIGYAGSLALGAAHGNFDVNQAKAAGAAGMKALGQIGQDAISEFAGADLASAAGQAVQGLGAALGVSVNNFLTLMLKGPTYKRHSFSWKISPNTPQETQSLSDLYRLISNAQAPGLNGAGFGTAFFSYPKIFSLEFRHQSGVDMSRMLFKFKPCVLTSSSWNFTPLNTPAFYGETKGPESVQFSLEFTDLEFFLSGDYD